MKTKLEKTLHHATDTITQLLLCLDRPDLIGEDFEEYKQNAMSEAGKVQKDIWFNYLRKNTPDNRKNLVSELDQGEIPDYDWWKTILLKYSGNVSGNMRLSLSRFMGLITRSPGLFITRMQPGP